MNLEKMHAELTRFSKVPQELILIYLIKEYCCNVLPQKAALALETLPLSYTVQGEKNNQSKIFLCSKTVELVNG